VVKISMMQHDISFHKKKYEEEHFVDSTKLVWNYSLFSDSDINNYQQGNLYNGYELFGNHEIEV
jgi:1,4-alpha-glucan branching enzyme